MSRSEVERFARALKSDPALLAEVGKVSLESMDAAVAVAGQHGYRFTAEDARAFLKAQAASAGKTLSDAELDRAAGGIFRGCTAPPPVLVE